MPRKNAGSEPQTRPLTSALKTFSLLDVIAGFSSGVRIAELARLTGASRATVYQQLVTLMAAGWMERTDDGRYCLTLRAARIGHAALEQASLGERIAPEIQRLAIEVGATVSVAILDADAAVVVQRVEPGHVLRPDLRVGTRFPLDVSATGRVLMAFSTQEQRELIAKSGIDLPSDEDMERIRTERYAVALYMEGVTALAAPIFASSERCIAALSVSGPPGKLNVLEASAALLASAREISRLTGGRQPPAARMEVARS